MEWEACMLVCYFYFLFNLLSPEAFTDVSFSRLVTAKLEASGRAPGEAECPG